VEISTDKVNAIDVVSIRGNLDTGTAGEAQQRLGALGGNARIVVDFSGVDYISSAGLRVLLATAKKLKKEGGAMRICNPNEMVREVFAISGFGTIFDVYDTRDAALSGF